MRQTHEIALVTLTQMRSDASRELAVAQLNSEPLMAIYDKIEAGKELTAYDELTLSMQPFVFFNQFENSHFLFVKGYITEEQWQSDLVAIKQFMTGEPHYAEYWSNQKHIFRKSYVEAIDQIFRFTNKDTILGILPFFHSFGFTGNLWLSLTRSMGVTFHVNPLDARVILGRPDEVHDRLRADRDRLGIDLLIVRPSLAHVETESSEASLRLLAQEIWPAIIS